MVPLGSIAGESESESGGVWKQVLIFALSRDKERSLAWREREEEEERRKLHVISDVLCSITFLDYKRVGSDPNEGSKKQKLHLLPPPILILTL